MAPDADARRHPHGDHRRRPCGAGGRLRRRRLTEPPPLKVLYILGSYRSGTTVLGNLLGQAEGIFSVGELGGLWRAVDDPDQRCGCGRLLTSCDVWNGVLAEAFPGGGAGSPELHDVRHAHRRLRPDRHSWLSVPRLLRRSGTWPPLVRYTTALEHLYRAIGKVTGCRVVVDSSKEAGDASAVARLSDVRPYFVHLVRDPRGVVYSAHRNPDPLSPPMRTGDAGRRHPARSAYVSASWALANVAAETIVGRHGRGRSLRVRYEDVVADPRGTTRRILAMAGEAGSEVPFVDATTVQMRPTHTVGGNWNRFETGPVTLRVDDEWVRRLGAADYAASTVVALPLLGRYRYPVRRETLSPVAAAPRS